MATHRNIMACFLAYSLGSPANSQDMSWQEKCEAMSQIAYKVMVNHQDRVPLEEALRLQEGREESMGTVLKMIILDAYEIPRYGTPESKANAARDYADQTLLSCLRAQER